LQRGRRAGGGGHPLSLLRPAVVADHRRGGDVALLGERHRQRAAPPRGEALTAKLALSAAVAAAIALAAAPAAQAQFRGIKCYGIIKAGQNDCAHAKGIHLCSGEALVDYDGGDWKLL